jgi:HAD superfamily hydrolase (TIGR01509 family)
MIKAIIFDWGGVLAPRNVLMAAKKLSKKHGLDEKTVRKELNTYEEGVHAGSDYSSYVERIKLRLGIPAQEIITALNSAEPNEVFHFVKTLKGYKLYLLSDQMKFQTDHIKKTFDLSFFVKVFFSSEIGHSKISKKAFELVLKEIKLKPEECVFIDDNPRNIELAQSVGLKTVLFTDLKNLKQGLRKLSVRV